MKKICICTTVSLTMKTFVVETAKYLYENCGYDITLICNEDKAFEESLPEYIHFIPVHMSKGIDFSALSSIKQFIRIFREQKFDMVQYSTPNAACYASIAAKIAKVPIRLYCQWGIRYVGLNGLSRMIFKAVEKMVCRNSTDIRATSPLNMEFGLSEGLYKPNNVSVVGHGGTIGVDTKKYDIEKKAIWRKEIREKYGLKDDEFVFGFSGRITVDKGCKELFSAFRKLEETKVGAKLFIVGPMDDNCSIDNNLVNWAKKSKNVILTGMVDSNEMYKYYSAMDMLIHPTYREGFGMVIQEAGALGVPAITTKIPGASEVMENGISCILAEPRDAESLYKHMTQIIANTELTTKLGIAARQRVEKYFERKIMLSNQKEDYMNLVEEK